MNTPDAPHRAPAAAPPRPPGLAALPWLVAPLLTVVLFSWVTDDAHLSFRSVENLLAGFGPRHNPDERVMVFTHPLWFALLVPGARAGLKPAVWSVLLGWGFTALLVVAFRRLQARAGAVAAWPGNLFLLAFASSFVLVEFQTSGLENSLTHFLLVATALFFVSERRDAAAFTALLLPLNRLDHALIASPFLMVLFIEEVRRRRSLLRAAARFALLGTPLVVWEIWATVYYGFPVPNTATAKLHPLSRGLERGLLYVGDWAAAEPLHAALVAAGLLLAADVLRRRRLARQPLARAELAALLLAAGAVVQVVYVVKIGGDFMRGRFLTSSIVASLLAAALVLGRRPPFGGREPLRLLRVAVVLAFGGALLHSWQSPRRNNLLGIPGTWIANEWRMYAPRESLLHTPPTALADLLREPPTIDPARQMTFYVSLGTPGVRYPANTKWLMAQWAFISDPFTARIPQFDPDSNAGHLRKPVPAEYLALEKASPTANYEAIDRAALVAAYERQRDADWQDPYLERLYYVIAAITREPVFSPFRLRALQLYYSGEFASLSREQLRPFKERHRPYW